MDFTNKVQNMWEKNNSLLCIGLDPDIEKIPVHLREQPNALFEFNKAIINATSNYVCAYKPNSAFYEAHGSRGIEQLKLTCDYILKNYPEVPILLDFKRGDIGNTNKFYATFAFEYLGVQAVTLQPWQGSEAIQVFLDYAEKSLFILDRTSNPGAGEFQNLELDGKKLYLIVAEHVKDSWNTNNNCHLVVGATAPEEMAEIRKLVGDTFTFLVPGLGAQGGDAQSVIKAGINSKGTGLIINSSRSILYSSEGEDFAESARNVAIQTRDEINAYR